jgi:hypothetical protein
MRYRFIVAIGLALLSVSSLKAVPSEQASDRDQTWHFSNPPNINTITVGSSCADVIKAFGKPLRVNQNKGELEGRPDLQKLHFKNLTVEIYSSEDKSPARVASIEVTGPGWNVFPNLRIGMTEEHVAKILQEAPSKNISTDTPWFISFRSNDIDINFYVRIYKGTVKAIGMSEDWR